jgi:two-component system response regulator FlrC
MTANTVLVVEDDRPLQLALVSTLQTAGFDVLAAVDGGEALRIVDRSPVDLVVTDVQMSPVDGRELLRRLKQSKPALPVLMMTAYGTIEQAVAAMQEGAADYLVKPFESRELEQYVTRYVRPAAPAHASVDPVAHDARTKALFSLARKVAATDVTVLLTGESGTGKEVVARYIHAQSPRSDRPFIAVNCAAIPEQMLEAILFGHEKGAFTGAQTRSEGKFVQANGGTLLLDEITEMDFGLQAKLLRVLQEREVEPLGASKPLPLDVRVLATSNRDLEQAVKEFRFREDLYYRLSVFPIAIPPLRERPQDIETLAMYFADKQTRGMPPRFADRALAVLKAYHWPGNVRELENVVQRALVLSQGEALVDVEHFALDTGARTAPASGLAGGLWEEEARRIVDALQVCRGSRKEAATQLGISARTLRYKLAKMRDTGVAVPGDNRTAT